MNILSQNMNDENHRSQISPNTPAIRSQTLRPLSANATTPRQKLIYNESTLGGECNISAPPCQNYNISAPRCPTYDISTPPCPNYDISTPITTNQNSPVFRDSASVCLPISDLPVEENDLDGGPLDLAHASDQPSENFLYFETEHGLVAFGVPVMSPSMTESMAGCTFVPKTTSSKLLMRSVLHQMEPFPNQLVSVCSTDCLMGIAPTPDPSIAKASFGKNYSHIQILIVLAGLTFLAGVSFFGIFLLIVNLSQTSYAARLLNEAIFTDVQLKMTELPDGRLMYSLNGMLKTESPTVAELELSELEIQHVLHNGILVPKNNWINPKVLEEENQYKIPIGTMTTNEIVQIRPSRGEPFEINTTGLINVTNTRGLASVVESSLGHKYPIFLLLKGTANLNLLNSLNFTNIPFQKVIIAQHEIANPKASIELEEFELRHGEYDSMYFEGSLVIRNSGPIEVGKLNPMNFTIKHNKRKLGEASVGSFKYTHGENRVALRGPITIPNNIQLRTDLLADAIRGTPIVLTLAGTKFPTNSTFSKAIIESELPFTIPNIELMKMIEFENLDIFSLEPIIPPGFSAKEDTENYQELTEAIHPNFEAVFTEAEAIFTEAKAVHTEAEAVHTEAEAVFNEEEADYWDFDFYNDFYEEEYNVATDQRSHTQASDSTLRRKLEGRRPWSVYNASDPASLRRKLETRRRWAVEVSEIDRAILQRAEEERGIPFATEQARGPIADRSFQWSPLATPFPLDLDWFGIVKLKLWHPFVSMGGKKIAINIPFKGFSTVRKQWEDIGYLNGTFRLEQQEALYVVRKPTIKRLGIFDGKFQEFEAYFEGNIHLDNVVQAFPNEAVGADYATLTGDIFVNDIKHTIDEKLGPLNFIYKWDFQNDREFLAAVESKLKNDEVEMEIRSTYELFPVPRLRIDTGPIYWDTLPLGAMETSNIQISRDEGIVLRAKSAFAESIGGSVTKFLFDVFSRKVDLIDLCLTGRPHPHQIEERFFDKMPWGTIIQGMINRVGSFCLPPKWHLELQRTNPQLANSKW